MTKSTDRTQRDNGWGVVRGPLTTFGAQTPPGTESADRGPDHSVSSPAPPDPGRPASRPWRIEGLPERDDEKRSRPRWWIVLLIAAIGYLVLFGILSLRDSPGGLASVPYTEFINQVRAGNVSEVFAQGDTIQGNLREAAPLQQQEEDETYKQFTTERPTFAQDDLLAELSANGADVSAKPLARERGLLFNLLLSFGPITVLVLVYWWMLRRMRKSGGGMLGGMFGTGHRSKPVSPRSVRTTFADVAGIDEVKAEIFEIVDFLKNPEKYRKLGARAPKGVLLSGPPGTGKTLLARATAGEAGVPFFSASGAEFIEMIVGVGASRVRELFSEARKVAPSIIFIDEIDTIGRSRGGSRMIPGGGHDEREQTLNQILSELDGFTGSEGVVVLAATNRPDVLDPALMRPGRFDRDVHINPPDQRGRADIMAVHVRKVPLSSDVDLVRLSQMTPGMTGADLANLVNEAALLAARREREAVSTAEFEDALEKIRLGTARQVVIPEADRRRTAYHEAGHALLGILTPGADPVRKVSIIPRGRGLGATLSSPDSDRYGLNREYLLGRIIGALAGMAAEREVFGVVTTGAESDLEAATAVARQMVGRWGMSEKIGPITVLPKDVDPRMTGVSEDLLAAVDSEVRALIDEAYRHAQRQLADNRDKLDTIANELLARETLDESELYALVGMEHSYSGDHEPSGAEPTFASGRP